MISVVITQPMYFPWIGMLEQMRLADHFVSYAGAAFSKGGFTNRVQVKTANGVHWLTVPLRDAPLGCPIEEVRIDERSSWRRRHRATLAQAYAKAPFVSEMLDLVDQVFEGFTGDRIGDLSMRSMRAVHAYFKFPLPRFFHSDEDLEVGGSPSERVLGMVVSLGGSRYITGHGAKNYLEHDLFEQAGVSVEYLNYEKTPYPQLHGDFTPFVSSLDLIANVGRAGVDRIRSGTVPWRQFLQ